MRERKAWVPVLVFLVATWAVAGDLDEALWEAARQGDLPTVKRLQAEGVDLDTRTRYGASALSFACDKGHLDVARYLVEAGVDVNSKDTFYGFTPIGWTLFNDHTDITLLLLSNGADGVDQVLMTGVRKGVRRLVEAALAHAAMESDFVDDALDAAREIEGGEAIVKLLEAAEVRQSVHEEVDVAASILDSYVGSYKHADSGVTLDVRIQDGKLVAQGAGQPLLVLRALSERQFEAVADPSIGISFRGRGGVVERVVVEQGPRTQVFRPFDASAAIPPETPEEPQATPEVPPARREIVRLAGRNWPSFRGGPSAAGVADGQGAPMEWDVASGHNIRWKTPVPGLANSSPVVWGDRVFVTTAISGGGDDTFRTGLYGDVDSVDDDSEHVFKVYALDKKSGKILWERTAATAVPGARRHLKSTQSNSTPATDGKRVVALFGSVGVLACFDVNGKPRWTADVGVLDAGWFYDKSYQWGHASSPVIYKDTVIVQADIQKDSFIAAYRLSDGTLVWKTRRDEIPTWGSPAIYTGGGRDEVITNGTTIRGYDPASGRELWTLGPNSEVTVATPVVAGGLIYVTAGYPPVRPVYAIKPGGKGDLSLPEGAVASEAIAWSKSRGGTYMPTPLVYEDYLYTCANNGRLTCYEARTGEVVYRERIGDGGSFTASPIAADGRLYFANEDGDVFVVRAGPRYEELARNAMGEVIMATPAIADGLMVLRTLHHVYGIHQAPAAAPQKP